MHYPVTIHQADLGHANLLEMLDASTDTRPTKGYLTTEHAASSHGIPVVVTRDGVALGSAECPPITIHRDNDDVSIGWEAEIDAANEAARAAGYRIAEGA